MNPTDLNPHDVLGLAADASLEEVRRAYLRLVREHPPDRDPDKFREIHSAYTLLNDPMEQAKALLALSRDPPDLTAIIAAAETRPLRIPKLPLLALGNQDV